MSDSENVKVAVRVRPFNKRERARDATLIVDMKGGSTYLKNPENPTEEPRKFAFDFSYWSHDGCKEEADGYFGQDASHPNGKKFADQKQVYADLGQGVLNNAWEGFNSTLFAYGQTGSGKSWSMVGYGINKGIVPLFCDTMFQGIDKKKADGSGIEFEVSFSMLEIYNEQVRDLLSPSSKKGGLKVRQHPKKGFYAEGLTEAAVGSYKEIESRMEEGTTNRTVAATNMNATSSRAHTIVGITFSQKFKNAAGEDTTKTAIVNLVDLAGSERAESTGATGQRLKEGAAINQSLSSLGNCIAALADRAGGKDVRVPFRDSVLTKLLKNALGGNSKTIMIAAVSPADINYDESLSTLRYADRAKQIKTSAKVNEDPTEKLIRELQEENDRLKAMLQGGGVVLPKGSGEDGIEEEDGMTEEEKAKLRQELEEEYKAGLEENERQMEEMRKTFEEKLKAAQASSQATSISENAEKKKTVPHIYNLNFDSQLSGKIIYFIDVPSKTVGKSDADITIVGPSMQDQHAVLNNEGGSIFIDKTNTIARLLRNGEPITSKIEVHHNDRLMFGTTQSYVVCIPKERDASQEPWPAITYESAQEEIAANSGFDMSTSNKSRDDLLLQEDLMEMLPAVEEANAISEELDKKMKFEVIIVSPEARGQLKGRTEIFVKVINLETDHEWVWTRAKFFDRKYVMQELYQKFQEGEDVNVPSDQDPFVEEDAEVHVGSVKVWLQSLAYRIELKEQLEVTDFKGQEVGLLNVEIIPCDKKGKEYTEKDDMWVDDPVQMIGKDVHFIVKIESARGLPTKFMDFYAKFLVYLDEEFIQTAPVADTINPNWKFKKQFSFCPATQQLVNYLRDSAIMIQIWGKQKPLKSKKVINTKDILQKQSLAKGHMTAGNTNFKTVDQGKVKFMMMSSLMAKKQEKLEQRLAWMRKLVETAEANNKKRIATKLVRGILEAPTEAIAQKHLKAVKKEKHAEHSDSSDDDEKGSKTCEVL